MDIMTGNQQFLLGLVSTLIAWAIAKLTSKTLDRTKFLAALEYHTNQLPLKRFN